MEEREPGVGLGGVCTPNHLHLPVIAGGMHTARLNEAIFQSATTDRGVHAAAREPMEEVAP